MKETLTHIYFWGSLYSQWFKAKFVENQTEFSSAEQYMMFHKALLFSDHETANKILATSDVKKQKALGRQVKGFSEVTWSLKKLDIVTQGNFLKFSQNENLKKQLLASGTKILVEGSPYDRIWGVGLHYEDELILDEKNWKGENLLGKALMEVRSKLK